jgi:hypothetical protein
MSWMNSIVSWLKDIEGYFYDAYLEVYGWIYPFWLLSYPVLYASRGFGWLAYYFSLFNNWLVWAQGEMDKVLGWSTIWSYILSYVPNLVQIKDWFYSWATNVTNTVNSWWSATQATVQGWISTAVQPFNSMLTAWSNFWNNTWPGWVSSFNTLKAAWDNFWSYTLPNLVSFTWLGTWWDSRLTDVQGLINSGFTARQSLWSGWQDIRTSVLTFFQDPVEFIWDRFTEWFLGPEG